MKTPFFIENLRSNYCKLVFLISIFIGFILTPKRVFVGGFQFIAYLFIVVFAFTVTCFIRGIKEKVKVANSTRHSILGIVGGIVGISALQLCGVGAPICGASIGLGILSALLPAFIFTFIKNHAEILLGFSILVQVYSLFRMNCLFSFQNNKKR